MKRLTVKQQRFAELVLQGKSQREAYRLAYPGAAAETTIATESSRTATLPHVKAYIEARMAEERAAASLTREDMILAMGRIVKRVGKDANASARDVVAATTQASRMLGCDAPTKIEMKVEGSLLHRIRKKSAA